jgi:uncharacterized membrane protein YqjE
MSTARLRRLALGACLLVAAVCIVSVLVAVVITGSDGTRTDALAVLAVAALVASWRLHRHQPHETA